MKDFFKFFLTLQLINIIIMAIILPIAYANGKKVDLAIIPVMIGVVLFVQILVCAIEPLIDRINRL